MMRLVFYVAITVALQQPGASPKLVPIACLCWGLAFCELAVLVFPKAFKFVTLSEALVGERRGLDSSPNAVLPWMNVEEMARCERALAGAGFRLDAAFFLLATMREVTREEGLPVGGRHIHAAELCAALANQAWRQSGDVDRAAHLLDSLGLRGGEDVGQLVAVMIDLRWLGPGEDDRTEDFRGLSLGFATSPPG